MQLVRAEPSLKGRKFFTLLDFESPDDVVFVTGHPKPLHHTRRAHTGRGAVALGSASKINLESVLMGKTLPGDWTLVGGYVWCERAASVDLRCTVAGVALHHTIEVPARQWTPAFIDPSCDPGRLMCIQRAAPTPRICQISICKGPSMQDENRQRRIRRSKYQSR